MRRSPGQAVLEADRRTLQRRHVRIDGFRFIGKESNKLEELEVGMVHDPQSVYTVYPDNRRDEWATRTRPALKAMPLRELQEKSGLSRATLQAIRAGRRPHGHNQRKLSGIVQKLDAI